MSALLSAEQERANLRTFVRLVTVIEASDGKLNLLLAVCDRPVERDAWIRRYEAELQAQGLRCYRVQLAQRSPSLKQSLLALQEQGGVLGAGAIVSVLGATELLDLRLGEERSALEQLLFSLQWTREALRSFECPIVIWVSNKVVNGIATTSPDFWSWRGNSVFEFVTQKVEGKEIKVAPLQFEGEALELIKPNLENDQSELGRKAAAQWEELEVLLQSDPKSPLLARLYQNLGFTERDRGNWDSAETVINRAIQLHQVANNRAGETLCLGVLGDIECKRGNWDAAEQLYRQCLQIEEELGDRAGMATSWSCLGDIERNRGNWDAAEQLYRQSLQLREELGDREGITTSWGQLGDIERKRGNWDAAEQLYRQSLQLSEELGDRAGIAISWGQLGDIERYRGNWDTAEQLFRQYQKIYEELGDRAGMALSLGVLGDIERKRGNWDAAEQLFRQYQQMCEELGDRAGMAASMGCLGENELGRGNLDEAETLLKDALLQMQQLGMIASIAETHWDLTQLYHTKNQPELAHQHYTTAHQLFTQLGAIKDLEKIEAEGKTMGF
ncbi:tetratricopeptide repeat protein [Alkalinema pantanalense CENA528]|uniref:tetratricopeptide repeat protein n=1 Tax=Alkalinema pantanalense TaxID=1620705 RepID=UPI003D6FAE8E